MKQKFLLHVSFFDLIMPAILVKENKPCALPLHLYTRSDQMIISWEKQNTPSRPPLSVES